MRRDVRAIANREPPWAPWLVLAVSAAVAVMAARPYAGSWNDGSRLASVEALVDHGTLAIDDSIFVHVPAELLASGRGPYQRDNPWGRLGTQDKLFIAGHYYSDKPPVISCLMAGLYQAARWCGLPRAAERPDLFCWLLTLATSSLAYVAAVWFLWRLGGVVGLGPSQRLGWTASFGLATVAVPYAEHVNNHMLLLAVATAILLTLAEMGKAAQPRLRLWTPDVDPPATPSPWVQLATLGTLAGLGYNLDLAAGPMLLVCLTPLIAYRSGPAAFAVFALAVVPWVVACHAMNYAIGGVLGPLNSVPAYFVWPGSPFSTDNMTGLWRHSPLSFVVYALALLFGKRGIIGHNLPLYLVLPALAYLVRRRTPERPEVAFAAAWCGGTWLLYGALSNNSSGACVAVRWLVPLVAPGFYLAALYLRQFPSRWKDFAILSAGGLVLAWKMCRVGPWTLRLVPQFWQIHALTLLAWGAYRVWLWQQQRQAAPAMDDQVPVPKAA
jgi:hypothetical protein